MDDFWHQHELELREMYERVTQDQRESAHRAEGQLDVFIVGVGVGRDTEDRPRSTLDRARME
jgi:hypothetical protein